ncbi:MAG: hypothetical protein H6Q59_2855 [Firmicutes bacterium]|nr:hypothetical protein [Bacillota bacterium]
MGKEKLKEILLAIREDNYSVPQGLMPFELSMEMMDYIGDTDDELRDDLILSNLSKWIIDGILSNDEIKKLLNVATDEKHLYQGMGESNDTVFCRTFSVLVVALIIYKHRMDHFLAKEELQDVLSKVLGFYNEDLDVRGYIDGKGWAHGAAHGADALDELARCEELGREELLQILNSIYKKVNISHYGYIHFEEERMITAVKAVLERKVISDEQVEAWIRGFAMIEKSGIYQEDQVMAFNIHTFLQSLYFRLIDHPDYVLYGAIVKEVLMLINRFNKL